MPCPAIPAAIRATTLLAMLLLPGRVEAQGRAFGTVAASATVIGRPAPAIALHALTAAQVVVTPRHALVTRQVEASANVPYALVVQRAASPIGRAAIEVRDHRGAWVRLAPGGRVTVFETRDHSPAVRAVECRVTERERDGAADACLLAFELISIDPERDVRVTARLTPTHTGY